MGARARLQSVVTRCLGASWSMSMSKLSGICKIGGRDTRTAGWAWPRWGEVCLTSCQRLTREWFESICGSAVVGRGGPRWLTAHAICNFSEGDVNLMSLDVEYKI